MFRFYLNLTAKNLFRHKRRTILTALAIAIGIFSYVVLDSIMAGTERDAGRNFMDYETGQLQVTAKAGAGEDQARPSLKHLVPEAGRLAARIAALPEVRAVSPRLLFAVTLGNGYEELPTIGVGVDPGRDAEVFAIASSVRRGRWLRAGQNEVVMGRRVAELLGVGPGDQIVLRTQTKTLTFQALDLTVAGLLNAPDPLVNESQVFLPLDVAQEALGTGDAASLLAVRLNDLKDLSPLTADLRGRDWLPPSLKVMTWEEAAANFLAAMETDRSIHSVFLFVIFIISTIGIVNTVLLASLERVREIGLFKALGLTENGIVRLFVYEGIGLGLIGGLIGVVLATVTNYYLVNFGYSLKAFVGDMAGDLGFPTTDRLYGAWNWITVFWALVFSSLVSLVASYLPARKAARLKAVEALRRV